MPWDSPTFYYDNLPKGILYVQQRLTFLFQFISVRNG